VQSGGESDVIGLRLLLFYVFLGLSLSATAEEAPASHWVERIFPNAVGLADPVDDGVIWPVQSGGEVVGYLFETIDIVDIPAYSGKPINVLVGIDLDGNIAGARVFSHHEPILLVGIPEQKLHDFVDQYAGKSLERQVIVGHVEDGSTAQPVDAVSGATVTVKVANQTIVRAASKVAERMGILATEVDSDESRATVKRDGYQEAGWQKLLGDGSIRRLHLTHAQVDDAFVGTEAEGVNEVPAEHKNDTFIDLYYTYLNVPTIGRNLLGDSEYEWLMETLEPGEHAIAVMGNGYSFKGSGYVRGGIFDRLQVEQREYSISFHDLDHHRIGDLYAGAPSFSEKSLFIIRAGYDFAPAQPWKIQLLVHRKTGPLDSIFTSFNGHYQLPDHYVDRPAPTAASQDSDQPLWVSIWYDSAFKIAVLSAGLLVLTTILFLQDWLVRYPRFLHTVRLGFLVYTVFFIGWYALGQLSIVNVFTFTHALMGDFRWELFLMDPVIFILWTFVAASILLWGRGIFCGWLCPFGAIQELVNEFARKIRIKQFELPFSVHERLWAIKYIILLVLFGISLESLSQAELYAEVEPFKTAILMRFQRDGFLVAYAVGLIIVSVFTRKFYCRYICPLGAALAVPTKFRLFDWLKRRKECGQPCQLCAKECEIQAIHPDGTINANECHHCLDCQMTYHNHNKCPPLVNKRKKRNRRKASSPASDSSHEAHIPVRLIDDEQEPA